jgi:hypothetical protein
LDRGTSTTRGIPASLVGLTVNELLLMANQALAGEATACSLSDINQAVTAINESFDECRFIGTCPLALAPVTVFGAPPTQ